MGKLVIISASMVIIPDNPAKQPYVHLSGTALSAYLGVYFNDGQFVTAVVFDEPIPYDQEIFFERVEQTASIVPPATVPMRFGPAVLR